MRAMFIGLLLSVGVVGSGVYGMEKPAIAVVVPTAAEGVSWPYDMKQLQAQLVAELKVMLGDDFAVSDAVDAPPAGGYVVKVEVESWRAGNAAKRVLVGLGSGREAADIRYQVADASNKTVVDHKDTIRTNFYSQGAGSTGTLAHPLAQKIADRIKDARLK